MSNAKKRTHKVFVAAILTEEIDPTQPVKRELLRIKERAEKTLNAKGVMVQDLG